MKDIGEDIFNVPIDKHAPECGYLLVSEPFLEDSFFKHSVVSIIEYDRDEGAMGTVMNHVSRYKLAELLENSGIKVDVPVYCGGPLGLDQLYFLHCLGPKIVPGAREYAPGLYIGGDFGAIIDYINSEYPVDGCVRFFVGYSGWTVGQLEGEIDEDTWALAEAPISSEILFSDMGDAYWHRTVCSLGEIYRSWLLIPDDMSNN